MRSETFSGNIEKVAGSLGVFFDVSSHASAITALMAAVAAMTAAMVADVAFFTSGDFCWRVGDAPELPAEDVLQPDGGFLVPVMGFKAMRPFLSDISVDLSSCNDEGDVETSGGGRSRFGLRPRKPPPIGILSETNERCVQRAVT